MHNSKKLEVGDDTEQWDWIPATTPPRSGRGLGTIALAASCLAVGILLGVLGEPHFKRANNMAGKIGSDTPARTSQSSDVPASEPTLALGGPDAGSRLHDAEPKRAVTIINQGASKTLEQRPDGPESRAEILSPEPRDAIPKRSDVATPRPETRRRDVQEPPTDKGIRAKPVNKQMADRPFKNYSDLRSHVLGK
jgi:hypothetical protein